MIIESKNTNIYDESHSMISQIPSTIATHSLQDVQSTSQTTHTSSISNTGQSNLTNYVSNLQSIPGPSLITPNLGRSTNSTNGKLKLFLIVYIRICLVKRL